MTTRCDLISQTGQVSGLDLMVIEGTGGVGGGFGFVGSRYEQLPPDRLTVSFPVDDPRQGQIQR